MTSKDHALPQSAFVEYRGESVAFQRLLEHTDIPCAGKTELFFADPEDEVELDDPSIAEDICLDCPIMLQCRQFARQTGQEYGVFGGESAQKRAKFLRAQRRRKKH